MSETAITLPTNRDENWRYANLRPLARARAAAVVPGTSTGRIELPALLPGYERWVFVDGRFAAAHSSSAPDSCARLLSFSAAGEALAKVLDSDIGGAGVDFALARANGAHGDEVLLITPADGAEARLELNFVVTAPASAGTSYPRVQVHAGSGSHLRIVERHLGSGAADPAVNAAFDLALRAGAQLDHCRVQSCADGASCFDTLTAHVSERAVYRLRTVTLGGQSSRSTIFVKLAGREARCELFAAAVANRAQTHDIFAEIEHAAPATIIAELRKLEAEIAEGLARLEEMLT